MNIGIIGFGVVGKAIEMTMSKFYEVTIYDKYQESYSDFKSVTKTDIIFISVPTPFDCSVGGVDESAIVDNLSLLQKFNFNGIVIIKSTIPPGSCSRYEFDYDLKICFNPEFLRESTTPNEDFRNQKEIVIGTKSDQIFDEVKKMYSKVCRDDANYYKTTTTEAEMIKYSQNTMLASRVAIANMIYDACVEFEVDYDIVKNVAFDKFDIIGPQMTLVPGPDGMRGFGGKCLPKDIRGFSTVIDSELVRSIISYNDSLRNDLHKVLINYSEKDDFGKR